MNQELRITENTFVQKKHWEAMHNLLGSAFGKRVLLTPIAIVADPRFGDRVFVFNGQGNKGARLVNGVVPDILDSAESGSPKVKGSQSANWREVEMPVEVYRVLGRRN